MRGNITQEWKTLRISPYTGSFALWYYANSLYLNILAMKYPRGGGDRLLRASAAENHTHGPR
jgi:hypothetical protein